MPPATLKVEGEISAAVLASLESAPVSSVTWYRREALSPNGYNPNRVPPPELELLIISIAEDGFTQPIVILPDRTIVDGFHRWHVSSDPRIVARYSGFVPTVTIVADPVHRQMATIRHNRARGVHCVLPMAEIVRGMLAQGVSREDICSRVGMEPEEVARLADRAGMPERMRARGAVQFGSEWVPARDA